MLKQRLQLECKEKQTIIKENHIELDEDIQRGRELFKGKAEFALIQFQYIKIDNVDTLNNNN